MGAWERNMKNVNATFSLPQDLLVLLKSTVERKNMSRFVAKTLKEALMKKTEEFKAAYREAARDEALQEELKEWDAIDNEGWSE